MLNQLELTNEELRNLIDIVTDRIEECEARLSQITREPVETLAGGAKRIESLKSRIALLNGIVNKGDALITT